jgi:hypothetical protein
LQLARFFHSGPNEFRNSKLALRYLNEVFLLDSSTRTIQRFFVAWHEDLLRPAKELHQKWRLVALLFDHLSREGLLELLALSLQRLAPLLDAKPPQIPELYAPLIENGMKVALQLLEARLPTFKPRSPGAVDLFRKAAFMRKAALAVSKALHQEDFTTKADKILADAMILAYAEKNRPKSILSGDVMAFATDQWPELARFYEWRMDEDKSKGKKKKAVPDGQEQGEKPKTKKRKAADDTTPQPVASDAVQVEPNAQPNTNLVGSETTPNPDEAPASPSRKKRTRKVYQKTRVSARTRERKQGDSGFPELGASTQNPDAVDVDAESEREPNSENAEGQGDEPADLAL